MKVIDRTDDRTEDFEPAGADLLSLVARNTAAVASANTATGILVGELLAITDEGRTPLVRVPDFGGSAAVRARSVVDLHAAHIGAAVVLAFEGGDERNPIVLGVLRGAEAWPLEAKPAQVDVDADGKRLVVTAKEQLVLRCGKASITLTKAGKVLIEGAYVSSRSSGVIRLKGGSIQLN